MICGNRATRPQPPIMLKAVLFGAPQVHHNHKVLTGTLSGRCLALFAYLALSEQPQARGHLADLLWSEIGEQQARQNLRYVLYDLRKLVGDYLIVTRDTVAFAHHQPCWIDAKVFTKHLTLDDTVVDLALLQGVLQLYQGELLTGFAIQNAPGFEEWLSAQRRYFHEQTVQAFLLLADRALAAGDYASGLTASRCLLQLEPWREEAYRMQMRLLAYSGHRLEALALYATCRQAVQAEFGVEPEEATIHLREAIATGELISSAPPAAKPKSPALQVNWDAIPTLNNLVGRDVELAQLHHWVVNPQQRLIGLFGFAGQGKSVLGAELVADLAEAATTNAQPAPAAIEVILWATLTTFPTLAHLLQEWMTQLTALLACRNKQPLFLQPALTLAPVEWHAPLETLFQQLLAQLRRHRILLIIDAGEALYGHTGALTQYQPGWEAFDELLRRLADNEHRSCLLFLSRITPPCWETLARRCSAVRTLPLTGLAVEPSVTLLRMGNDSPPHLLQALATQCAGHPQTLIALRELLHIFGCELLASAWQEPNLVGAFLRTLADHFACLSPLEQTILLHLTLLPTPSTAASLWQQIPHTSTLIAYLEALQTLQRHHWLLPSCPGAPLLLAPLAQRFMAQHVLASSPERGAQMLSPQQNMIALSWLPYQGESEQARLGRADIGKGAPTEVVDILYETHNASYVPSYALSHVDMRSLSA